MIDQRNKNIYFAQAMSDFFKGFIDFKGYSSRKGHWIPTITITLSFIIILLVIAGASILSFMGASNNLYYGRSMYTPSLYSMLGYSVLGLILLWIVIIILAIPLTASFARRLRDAGFTESGIVVAIVLYYFLSIYQINVISSLYSIVFVFVLMSFPSNYLETNKNEALFTFFFRQTPAAKAHYSQFSPFNTPQQNFNNPQQFNNQQPVNTTPQFNQQQPLDNQVVNQQPVVDNQTQVTSQNVVEKTPQNVDTPNTNPFGDKPFKKE